MTLESGRTLDALVAEKVMGWKKLTCGYPGHDCEWYKEKGDKDFKSKSSPAYSTDIAAAWEVLTCGKWTWTLEEMDDGGRVSCYLENEDDDIFERHIADTAPMAICLAALQAVGVVVD